MRKKYTVGTRIGIEEKVSIDTSRIICSTCSTTGKASYILFSQYTLSNVRKEYTVRTRMDIEERESAVTGKIICSTRYMFSYW